MKRFSLAIGVLTLLAGLVYAAAGKEYKGYLADNMCAASMKDNVAKAKGHDKSCALSPSCADSGFALVTEDGKVIKLDADGSKKAHELFKNSKSTKGLAVTIEGSVHDDTLKVDKITESTK